MFRVPAALAHKAQDNMPLDANTFIFFSLRPDSKLLSTENRTKAIALSILMGVLTLGVAHLVCKIICEIRKHQANAHVGKIISIAQKDLGCSKEVLEAAVPAFVAQAFQLRETDLTPEELTAMGELLPFMTTLASDKVKGRALQKQIDSLMDKDAKQLVGLLALEQMDQQLRNEARLPVRV